MYKKLVIAGLISMVVSGCQEGEISLAETTALPTWLPVTAPQELSEDQLHRLVQRTTTGLSPSQRQQITDMGYVNWLNKQFSLPIVSHHSLFNKATNSLSGYDTSPKERCGYVNYQPQTVRESVWWGQTLYGNDHLRQRATFALSQLLVVSKKYSNINMRNPQTMSAYYDILQKHAFGNYRELLETITLSPSMGAYLSMANSRKHNPKRGTYPDENFAREVMQLFTIGLYELNLDGSAKVDHDGNVIYTYQQKDVQEVARALSGWTYADPSDRDENNKPIHGTGYIKPMVQKLDGKEHDFGEKHILGHTIVAGQEPEKDMQDVLDILFNHPNTAPFVAKHLIQRLVTSNPSPEYIKRVAEKFEDNGEGVRGDLQSVFAAVWLDPEALGEPSNPNKYPVVKLKEPVLAVAEAMKILGAYTHGSLKLTLDASEAFNMIGQGPLTANSVFNFYSPDFSPSGPLLEKQWLAPEFEILPWAGFIGYQNAIYNRLDRTFKAQQSQSYCDNSMYLKLKEYQDAVWAGEKDGDVEALSNLINERFLDGKMSAALRQAIHASVAAEGKVTEHSVNRKVHIAIALTVTSPEFLIQR